MNIDFISLCCKIECIATISKNIPGEFNIMNIFIHLIPPKNGFRGVIVCKHQKMCFTDTFNLLHLNEINAMYNKPQINFEHDKIVIPLGAIFHPGIPVSLNDIKIISDTFVGGDLSVHYVTQSVPPFIKYVHVLPSSEVENTEMFKVIPFGKYVLLEELCDTNVGNVICSIPVYSQLTVNLNATIVECVNDEDFHLAIKSNDVLILDVYLLPPVYDKLLLINELRPLYYFYRQCADPRLSDNTVTFPLSMLITTSKSTDLTFYGSSCKLFNASAEGTPYPVETNYTIITGFSNNSCMIDSTLFVKTSEVGLCSTNPEVEYYDKFYNELSTPFPKRNITYVKIPNLILNLEK